MVDVTLKNCSLRQLDEVMKRGLHPTKTRHELIFAAGCLNNRKLSKELGSAELCNFYDGQLAAGIIDSNPYWPRHRSTKNG